MSLVTFFFSLVLSSHKNRSNIPINAYLTLLLGDVHIFLAFLSVVYEPRKKYQKYIFVWTRKRENMYRVSRIYTAMEFSVPFSLGKTWLRFAKKRSKREVVIKYYNEVLVKPLSLHTHKLSAMCSPTYGFVSGMLRRWVRSTLNPILSSLFFSSFFGRRIIESHSPPAILFSNSRAFFFLAWFFLNFFLSFRVVFRLSFLFFLPPHFLAVFIISFLFFLVLLLTRISQIPFSQLATATASSYVLFALNLRKFDHEIGLPISEKRGHALFVLCLRSLSTLSSPPSSSTHEDSSIFPSFFFILNFVSTILRLDVCSGFSCPSILSATLSFSIKSKKKLFSLKKIVTLWIFDIFT